MIPALLVAASAFASSPESLRSDASFGLFRDPYDFLREPASLAEHPRLHVYTLVGNQGGADRASLGWLGKAGPGVLGVIADGTSSAAGGRNTTTTAATADDPLQVLTTRTDDRSRQGGLFAGYGLPLREGLSVGVGVQHEGSRWQTTLAPQPGSDPVIGGALSSVEDGAAEDGSYTERERQTRARLGASLEGDRAELEVDASVLRIVSAGFGETSWTEGGASYTWSGSPHASSAEDNLSAWLGALAVDATLSVGEAGAIRLFLEAGAGPGTSNAHDVRASYADADDPDAAWTLERELVQADHALREGQAVLVGELEREGLVLRGGPAASGDWNRYEAETREMTDDSDVSTAWSISEQALLLSLIVAAEQRATERWTLRTGAAWTHALLSDQTVQAALTPVGEGEQIEADTKTWVETSYLELALGARWDPGPMALDLVVMGTGFPDAERVALDLGSVLISAVFRP